MELVFFPYKDEKQRNQNSSDNNFKQRSEDSSGNKTFQISLCVLGPDTIKTKAPSGHCDRQVDAKTVSHKKLLTDEGNMFFHKAISTVLQELFKNCIHESF